MPPTSTATVLPNRRNIAIATAILLHGLAVAPAETLAQGLIWSLPQQAGTWVRYEGTYTQIVKPKEAGEAELKLEWLKQITLKCLNQEEAPYRNPLTQQEQTVPCRWVEIKVVTGKASETGIDPGPVGQRIYKVLIPESGVVGKPTDSDGIPVSFLPVIRGFVKEGTGEAQPLNGNVLRVYPTISLLHHYNPYDPESFVQESEQPVDAEVGVAGTMATKFKATHRMENLTSRWAHEAELWRSAEIPFGLARWHIAVIHESKLASEARDKFQVASETTVEMKAQEVGTDAKSELNVP